MQVPAGVGALVSNRAVRGSTGVMMEILQRRCPVAPDLDFLCHGAIVDKV